MPEPPVESLKIPINITTGIWTKADFYCYYPYSASVANVSAYPFAVKADQSSESDYKASDFLWGKTAGIAPTANPVQITVKHAMSNLLIHLKAGKWLQRRRYQVRDDRDLTITAMYVPRV